MDLIFEKFRITSANLGEESQLPDIHDNAYIRAKISLTDNVAEEDRKFVGKGMIKTLLPYRNLDSYDRTRKIKEYDSVRIENDYLKAVFVPELGGRLWSLYDKKNKKELLYKNDVFQPANLALRNAWFSGGVEWNVGIKGHNPLTCSPLFAQKVYNKDGLPVLKMYEYERIRGVVYSIYATLDKDMLLVKVCIENTQDKPTPMYWWSNIAVPETPHTRTIVPAKETFFCSYSDGGYVLDIKDLPYLDGNDITYAVNSPRSRDFFFKIPENSGKWIATADENGCGLLQISTDLLAGRKMFVWGQQNGGRHWNEWLTDKSGNYIEIQAGILRTQLEHFEMQAQSELSFIEGYCAVKGDPEKLHGKDYSVASREINEKYEERKNRLANDVFIIEKEDEISYYGSGFGAIENRIRNAPISKYCAFPEDSVTSAEKEWADLIDGKSLPDKDTSSGVSSFVVGKKWIELIENTLTGNWYEYLHLGVLYYADGDYEKSLRSFDKSIELKPNCWAYRNRAQLKANVFGDADGATKDMLVAFGLNSLYLPLTVEVAVSLMRVGKYKKWIEIYYSLSEEFKNNGRLKMLTGACYEKLGDTENALKFINEDLRVDDIKEGEYSISSIWTELYKQIYAKEKGLKAEAVGDDEVLKKYPVPFVLDYRMH